MLTNILGSALFILVLVIAGDAYFSIDPEILKPIPRDCSPVLEPINNWMIDGCSSKRLYKPGDK